MSIAKTAYANAVRTSSDTILKIAVADTWGGTADRRVQKYLAGPTAVATAADRKKKLEELKRTLGITAVGKSPLKTMTPGLARSN